MRIARATLLQLVAVAEALVGVIASSVFPQSLTYPLMLEIWLAAPLTEAASISPGASVFAIGYRMYTQRFVAVYEAAGLCLAVVFNDRPRPNELGLAYQAACLRLAHLGFEFGDPDLGTVTRRQAPRLDATRALRHCETAGSPV